jgi:hypothetical protein
MSFLSNRFYLYSLHKKQSLLFCYQQPLATLIQYPKDFFFYQHESYSLSMKFLSVVLVAAAAGVTSASKFGLPTLLPHRQLSNVIPKITLKATLFPTTGATPMAQMETRQSLHPRQRSSLASPTAQMAMHRSQQPHPRSLLASHKHHQQSHPVLSLSRQALQSQLAPLEVWGV